MNTLIAPTTLALTQGGNPGNGWWGANNGSGGLERSWEVIWNNTTGTITFNLYGTDDWTSARA